MCYRLIRCIPPSSISPMKSHDKSPSFSFVLFRTLLMEMNVPFSGLTQILLLEDFAQYLLGSLDRRGWELSYQLLNCPNATVTPLWPCGRWQPVERAVLSDKHPLPWQQKGSLTTGHPHTALCRHPGSKGAKEIRNSI